MAKYAIIKTFYASQKWINFRMSLIAERGNKCEDCKSIIARSIDIIAHHKIELTPENVNDYSISLNPKNVELICFECHNKTHKRFGNNKQRNIYIVYGAPLSGKKSFVKQNIMRGDIVIDIDSLYSAVSMLPSYDKPDNLFANVISIHNQLIDNIRTRMGKWNNAWVIGGYADKHKREKLANDLSAELIFCNVEKEECFRRLSLDPDRKYRQDEWKRYIDRWFHEYIG